MTKLRNFAQTFKQTDEFIDSIKNDEKYILNFLSIYKGLEFKRISHKRYACLNDKSSEVYLGTKEPVWFYKDWARTKGVTIEQLIKQEVQKYAKSEYHKQTINILSKIAGYVPDLQTRNKIKSKVAKRTKKTVSIDNRIKAVYTSWDDKSHTVRAALKFMQTKTGAEKYDLNAFSIKPVLYTRVGDRERITYNPNFFGIAFCTSTGTQIKVPKTATRKENKYLYIDNESFRFGLDQLRRKRKENVKYIILTEGAEDAICAQLMTGSSSKIHTLSFGGARVDKKVIKEIKQRFENAKILVLFDGDKAGKEASIKAALENELIHVDFKLMLDEFRQFSRHAVVDDVKDVCELYQKSVAIHGHINAQCVVEHFIRYCTKLNIVKTVNEVAKVFQSYIGQFYELEINQYISESKSKSFELLQNLLRIHDKLILSSAAGTGKTTMLTALCDRFYEALADTCKEHQGEKLGFIKNNLECKSVVVATPTTSIAEQLYFDFLQKGFDKEDVCLVTGGKKLGDVKEGSIIITVYDSLTNDEIYKLIPDALLVVDEFHQLANDSHYRKSTMFDTHKLLSLAKRKLLLSATPNLLFCTDAHETFNYKLIQCTPRVKNQIDGFIYEHDCKMLDLIGHIVFNSKNVKGAIIIKVDSISKLESVKKFLDNLGEKSTIFCSEKKYKENNSQYQNLMQTGKIDSDIKYILTTTLLEAGVSIKSHVSQVHILDTRNIDRIVQLATRARMQFCGTNSKVELYVYMHRAKEKNVYSMYKDMTSVEIFKEIKKEAEAKVENLNSRESNKNSYRGKTSNDESKDIVAEYMNRYEVNIAGILNRIYKIQNSFTDSSVIKKLIENLDDRFNFHIDKLSNVLEGELDEYLELVGAEQENSEQEFKELLSNDYKSVLGAMCYLDKNLDIKNSIRELYLIKTKDKEVVKQYIEDHKDAFAYKDRNKLLRLVSEITRTGTYKRNETVTLASSLDLTGLKQCRDKAVHKYREKNFKNEDTRARLSSSDQLEAIRYISMKSIINKLLENIKAGRTKNVIDQVKIVSKINRAIEKNFEKYKMKKKSNLTFGKVKKFIDLYYSTERKRVKKNKIVTSYYSFTL